LNLHPGSHRAGGRKLKTTLDPQKAERDSATANISKTYISELANSIMMLSICKTGIFSR